MVTKLDCLRITKNQLSEPSFLSQKYLSLTVVVIEPTAGDNSETIESSNRGLCEKSSEDVSDNTTNSMRSEDIETVIVGKKELQLSGEVADSASHDTEKDSSG